MAIYTEEYIAQLEQSNIINNLIGPIDFSRDYKEYINESEILEESFAENFNLGGLSKFFKSPQK